MATATRQVEIERSPLLRKVEPEFWAARGTGRARRIRSVRSAARSERHADPSVAPLRQKSSLKMILGDKTWRSGVEGVYVTKDHVTYQVKSCYV